MHVSYVTARLPPPTFATARAVLKRARMLPPPPVLPSPSGRSRQSRQPSCAAFHGSHRLLPSSCSPPAMARAMPPHAATAHALARPPPSLPKTAPTSAATPRPVSGLAAKLPLLLLLLRCRCCAVPCARCSTTSSSPFAAPASATGSEGRRMCPHKRPELQARYGASRRK